MEQTEKTTKIHIFVNRRKLEIQQVEITGAALLAAAGFEGDGWDLLQLHGEGDPTGGELVQADQVLHLKEADRFRVIPGNRTFGA